MSLEHTIYDQLKSLGLMLEDIQEKLDRLLIMKPMVAVMDSPKRVKEIEAMDRMIEMDTKEEEYERKNPIFGSVTAVSNLALPKTGKYQWYRFVNHEGKVRKCENEGCDLFLLWNKDKKTYEHWKYDVNTGIGGYVADNCEGVYNG